MEIKNRMTQLPVGDNWQAKNRGYLTWTAEWKTAEWKNENKYRRQGTARHQFDNT